MTDLEQAPIKMGDQEATVKQRPSSLTKLLHIGTSVLLLIVNCFAVYYISTMLDRIDCLIGNNNSTIIPPLIWYTTWTLITTTITWCVYLKRRYRPIQPDTETCTESVTSSVLPVVPTQLFRLCLPLSVTVMVAFTFYLVSNNWGRDFVDDELCYTLMDSAIPKEGTTEMGAAVFLTFDRIANFTAHYVCAAINIVLYWKNYEHKQGDAASWWLTLFPIFFIFVQSIAIVLVHEFVDVVYDTENIFLSTALTIVCFLISSAAFFYRKKPACCTRPCRPVDCV